MYPNLVILPVDNNEHLKWGGPSTLCIEKESYMDAI